MRTSHLKFLAALLFGGLALTAFKLAPKHVTIWMIGDSTMSIKDKRAYPETGWGMPFVNFFDSTVTVDNRAKNGRSTRTFIEEGLWKPVAENMQEGDYLIIQFGHNDEVTTKRSYTKPDEFKKNLLMYVNAARSKKATPVLLTPVARRNFDASGKVVGTHDEYSQLVRQVAQDNNVLLIDLDKKSQAMLQELGPEKSQFLFNYVKPGEHPNYPEGKEDNTHFSELGARKVAELVLAELRPLLPDLSNRVVKTKTGK